MRTLFLTMAMVLGGVPAAFAGANLIKDGGFEKPAPPVGGSTVYGPSQKIGPWVVSGTGNVSVNSTSQEAGPAWKGAAFLDLTGTCDCGASSEIGQTIPTTPGATYKLSFRLGTHGADPGINDDTSAALVYQDSSLLMTAYNKKPRSGGEQVWKRFTVLFTATGTQTTLTFIGDDEPGDQNCGLDDVVVTAER